jgi:hypothetical protein
MLAPPLPPAADPARKPNQQFPSCGRAAQPCYTFGPVALGMVCAPRAPDNGRQTGFGYAREVGLSQNGVELLAFGSTSVFALVKFVWSMKRETSWA